MVGKIFSQGKKIFTVPQTTVLSAASIIMVMIFASRILGLIRQRVLANFFAPDELSLFFAAFRLPDLIFEVLVYGTFSSAFIPIFTKALKKGEKEAWVIAGRVVNISLLIFVFFSVVIGIFAEKIYQVVAPGFSLEETKKIAALARILFAAQGFFVVSYVVTGVLESLGRFLVPALSPLFYNVGIILGTVFLQNSLGLKAPAVGVVIGAICHLLIQLPLAHRLGFRFVRSFKPNEEVKKIGRLALPRIVDLSFQQISKTVELFLASLISTASYTYFTFANSLQLLPVTLFGTSLAKATLPILAREESPEGFKNTLLTTLYQSIFLVFPMATILIILRIPLVRLAFGTNIFDWQATVQTGYVLSAFAMGAIFQTSVAILNRAYYALHDTKTPVKISLVSEIITIIVGIVLIMVFKLPVWALAIAFSLGSAIQSIVLFYVLQKKLKVNIIGQSLAPFFKAFSASLFSGGVMYFLLKFFDRSVWVKKLSFLSSFDISQSLPFEKFVLDTRYTFNLLVLTVLTSVVGLASYIIISFLMKSQELSLFYKIIRRPFSKEKRLSPTGETESITIPPNEDLT